MKIIVCYKYVPSEEAISIKNDRRISIGPDAWETGQYDLRAVEAGIQLVSAAGGNLYALTVGGSILDNTKLQKGILSRGPEQMYGVRLPSDGTVDTLTTAKLLAAAIDKIGGVDLVLCGEGSGDMYAQQTGNILGTLLHWTTVNAVSCISVKDNNLLVERSLEDGTELLEVPLPSVISVTSDINTPRIPNMKDILGAGKKPVTIWDAADVSCDCSGASKLVGVLAPEQTDRQQIIFDAAEEDGLSRFVAALKKSL